MTPTSTNQINDVAAPISSLWRTEVAFGFSLFTLAAFLGFGSGWMAHVPSSPVLAVALFAWLFGAMMWASFSVIRHAEALAHKLGEPLGTLILTLSVIGIEVVMISSIMLTGDNNPTLARETMFSVLMIVMNLLVGLTLLLGGLRHHEQTFNLQGASAYFAVILPLATFGLILPSFTTSTEDASASPLFAWFLGGASVFLYGVFLAMQTMRHRGWFRLTNAEDDDEESAHGHGAPRSTAVHALLLLATMVPIVLLAKYLAQFLDMGIEVAGMPAAVAGLVVALLVLTPEGIGAIRSAWNNHLMRSVNICVGSALATIALTIPAVLSIAALTGHPVELGLGTVEIVLLVLTLAVSMLTFSSGKTNVLQGAVHLVLFMAYIVLVFDGVA
jgi:Ca2+:H+ antiporter